MSRESGAPRPAPYRVAIEDRLAFEAEPDAAGLEAVTAEVARRLGALGGPAPDADLVVWRSGRVEAVVHWRDGAVDGLTRLGPPDSPRPRFRTTIGALMLAVLVAAPILAALRGRAPAGPARVLAMLVLFAATFGSLLMSIRHTVAFFRTPPR